MIPKIIHYTWFSGDPFPELIQECIDSWKKWMPDYDFKLWDMASVHDIDSVFLKEALKERKWACLFVTAFWFLCSGLWLGHLF